MTWHRLSPGVRTLVVVVGIVVGVNVAISALDSATRGADTTGADLDPGSTAPNGTSAWVELLETGGANVSTPRVGTDESPRAASTVMLGVDELPSSDVLRVRDLVRAGGRLVVGPNADRWVDRVVDRPPLWTPAGAEVARPVTDAVEVAGIDEVRAEGTGAWGDLGSSRALLAGDGNVVASVAAVGQGTVVFLADPSIVSNELLGEADNAGFALRIVDEGQPVQIFEPPGTASEGLAAVPDRWKLSLAGLVLAFLLGALARGRRVGPPDPPGTPRPPPRRTFVDAMGLALERTRRPGGALEPLRLHIRSELARRAGLPPHATDDELRAAARRLGWPDDEIDAVLRPATPDTVLAYGRALARVAPDRPASVRRGPDPHEGANT